MRYLALRSSFHTVNGVLSDGLIEQKLFVWSNTYSYICIKI